jgi:hypothetical protein
MRLRQIALMPEVQEFGANCWPPMCDLKSLEELVKAAILQSFACWLQY